MLQIRCSCVSQNDCFGVAYCRFIPPPLSIIPQSDAAAATSKAESMAATELEVSTQRKKMKAELERAALTAERNTLLQALVLSESERRKKVRWSKFRRETTPSAYSYRLSYPSKIAQENSRVSNARVETDVVDTFSHPLPLHSTLPQNTVVACPRFRSCS